MSISYCDYFHYINREYKILFWKNSENIEVALVCICGILFVVNLYILFMHAKNCFLRRGENLKIAQRETTDSASMFISSATETTSYYNMEVEHVEEDDKRGCFVGRKQNNLISLKAK